ncbi:hypothetical protein ACTXT7_011101 [Hymenolepis weldensis]
MARRLICLSAKSKVTGSMPIGGHPVREMSIKGQVSYPEGSMMPLPKKSVRKRFPKGNSFPVIYYSSEEYFNDCFSFSLLLLSFRNPTGDFPTSVQFAIVQKFSRKLFIGSLLLFIASCAPRSQSSKKGLTLLLSVTLPFDIT